MPKIGAHVSAAGGVAKAPLNARAEKCEVFQFFLHPPQSYSMSALNPAEITLFQQNCRAGGFNETYVHAAYLINLASLNDRVRYGSISLLRRGLEQASQLGVQGLMFHVGSAKGYTQRSLALKKAIASINKVLVGYDGITKLLIENSAGAGNTLGASFAEISQMLRGVHLQSKIGVCLDIQHSFATGYDWRTKSAVDATLREFNKTIGLSKLMVIHANDSQSAYGSNRDRHEHIGQGEIGKQGFQILLRHPRLKNRPFILETPSEGRTKDIAVLKALR